MIQGKKTTLSVPMLSKHNLTFKPVDAKHREVVRKWLVEPHAASWFYGQGLENTYTGLDNFLAGTSLSNSKYWLAYDRGHPFAFFITSPVNKPTDPLTRWCKRVGPAITLDMLIGDTAYLGKGLAILLIHEFLATQFSDVVEVLIDPEASNCRAVHVYQKAGFELLGEFIPSHSPNLHYMMRLTRSSTKHSRQVPL
jgi:GNAT superfamily N-acetyltransferase